MGELTTINPCFRFSITPTSNSWILVQVPYWLKMQSLLKCKVRSVTLFCGTVDARNPAQCKYRNTMIYCLCSIQYARNPAPKTVRLSMSIDAGFLPSTPQRNFQYLPFCHGHRQRRSKRSIGHGRRFTIGNWSLRFSWTLNMTTSGNVNIIWTQFTYVRVLDCQPTKR